MAATIEDPIIKKIAQASTEEDLISNTGETCELSLSLGLANDGSGNATVAVWITDSSGNHQYPLLPDTVLAAKKAISNGAKLTLAGGGKIRVSASTTDVYAMICPVSGL